ncbi:MAG TPA: hypothetical protein VLT58_03180 [Polyangia bacterium]|nr:hypothetical protein [Polyangia bacterium]
MRSILWVSLGLATALGACSQSLSGNLTGTGGAAAMTDVETGGKVGTGTGGTGGYNASACQAFAVEYDAAMTAARSCRAGATAQCMQPVSSSLSVCGSCPAFVTDASKLNAIQQMWQAANCDRPTEVPPCVSGPCPSGIPDVCIAGANGQGVCSYAGGGTGGSGGTTGGSGGKSGAGGAPVDAGPPNDVCAAYAMKYAIVLAEAKSCTYGAADQCAHAVPTSLSVCSGGCSTYVNDATDLNLLQQTWAQAGCNRAAVACPAIACVPAAGGVCNLTDTGGAACANTYPIAF